MNEDTAGVVAPFFRVGDRPSDPKVKKLIAQVSKRLKISRARSDECEVAICLQLLAAKGSSKISKSILPAGELAKSAESARSYLKKAQAEIKEIGPPFEALFDDNANYDLNRRYDDFMSLLDVAIQTADALSRGLIIPKGQKPRDIDKHVAKMAADNLVTQFCDLGDITNGLSLSAKRVVNSVAKAFYEYLTGNEKADLSGPTADFAPEKMTLKGTTAHVSVAERIQNLQAAAEYFGNTRGPTTRK